MPPRKFNNYKKKKMPHATKRVDVAQNKKIENLEKKFKSLKEEIEVKHKDTLLSGVELVSAPVAGTNILLLNGLSQGNTNITRIGDNVKITSIQFRGRLTSAIALLGTSRPRVIIFWDKQANGAAPAATDLLDNSVITRLTDSPYNHDYIERFDILYDKTWVIDSNAVADFDPATGTTSTVMPKSVKINKYKKLQRKVNYGLGNAGTVADISHNSLYLMLISETATGSNPPTAFMGIRINYRDA